MEIPNLQSSKFRGPLENFEIFSKSNDMLCTDVSDFLTPRREAFPRCSGDLLDHPSHRSASIAPARACMAWRHGVDDKLARGAAADWQLYDGADVASEGMSASLVTQTNTLEKESGP